MDEVPGMTQVLGGTRVPLDGKIVKAAMTTQQPEGIQKCYLDLGQTFGGVYDSFNELAKQLASEDGNGTAIDKLKAALPKLVAVQASNAARLEAIKEFSHTYQCSTEKTDFQEQLLTITTSALRRPGIASDPAGAVKQFEKAVNEGKAIKEGRTEDDDEDADLVITQAGGGGGGGGYQPPNVKCPISGMSLKDIQDPVEDDKGYVYERQPMEQYITQHTRRIRETAVDCPQSGTTHKVSLASLKPAMKLLRQRKVAELARKRQRDASDSDEDEDIIVSP